MWKTAISCLYRKGDRENITNWRPTLLLSYDNKIYAKILANKIQPISKYIIDPEETAAIARRTITENLQLNWEVMPYANANNIQVAIIMLYQEKAFDKVEWNFLFKALQNFGHGHEIIQKIKKSLSKHRHTGQGKRILVASVSKEDPSTARMPIIYDSVHFICGNIFREYKTKQCR